MAPKPAASQRVWWIAGAAAAAILACLLACGVGAFLLVRLFAGEPPGQGVRAQRGYQACAPIITALAAYHQAHGDYPDSLDALVPTYLGAVPDLVNNYPIFYHRTDVSYSLVFSYEESGMNRCTYTPEAQWSCYGYY